VKTSQLTVIEAQLPKSNCQSLSSPNHSNNSNLLSTDNCSPNNEKLITDKADDWSLMTDDCIDSSTECIEQLTEQAIANSSELVTIDEQIALIDKRLVVAGERIEHTSKKRWTNYLSTDPLRIAANVFGGGDVQRDNIAIADLEVKSAELEAYQANLHRRQAEVKSQLEEDILGLVLEYEAAEREYVLAQSKLATYNQQRQLIEIDYQFGNGSTTQMLSMWQQGESLEAEVIQIESKKAEITRKIQQLTGFNSTNNN
jgi:predicted ATPase